MVFFFGRSGRCVLSTKEEKDHPDCYQQQVQKPYYRPTLIKNMPVGTNNMLD